MENTQMQSLLSIVIFGTLGMLLFVTSLILLSITHKRKMLKNQLQLQKQASDHRMEMLINMNETQEKERARIAQDIHDEVGAIFYIAKMNAGELVNELKNVELNQKAKEIERLIISGTTELRKSIQALTPTTLEKFGFLGSLENLIDLIQKSSFININLIYDGDYLQLSHKSELAIFRVIQELINNALKHSTANNIEVKLIQNSDSLTIIISDDGEGFNLKDKFKSNGLGLKNIENRIFLIGGQTEISSSIGIGTVCYIYIPYEKNKKS